MRTPLTIAVIVGVVFLALILWAVVATILRERRFAKLPPRPAFRCPSCSSEQIDVLSDGLWDGYDPQRRATAGIFEYGLCKQCGGRCARFRDDQPFVPTDVCQSESSAQWRFSHSLFHAEAAWNVGGSRGSRRKVGSVPIESAA